MVILFLLAVVVFGGWDEGPVFSGAKVAANTYGWVAGIATTGNTETGTAMGTSVVHLVLIFVVNLLIYYILSLVIIFIYNLFFGG